MSLKRHITNRKSPVSEFLRTQFPNIRDLLADPRKQVRQVSPIRQNVPVRWDIVGMALDYRIRYYFDATPCEELAGYRGARLLTEAQTQPLLDELDFHWTGNRNDRISIFEKASGKVIGGYMPELNGGWCDSSLSEELGFKATVLGERVANSEIAHESTSGAPLMTEFRDFFSSLRRITKCNSPIGKKLSQHSEDELNCHCVVLALLEEAIRTGNMNSDLATRRYNDVNALLTIAEPHWIDDLRELSWEFYDEYGYLTARPFVLNPTFEGSGDVGGADADLIVDGNLIEIKCTIKNQIQPDWLRQILGYVLLDYSDRYQITGIGIYMARQGLLFQWGLEEALEILCSGTPPTIAELRSQFKKLTGSLAGNRKPVVLPWRE